MTDLKDKVAPMRRIILAIDASEASAKAAWFVRTKFQMNRSTSEDGRVPIHVVVVHVMARRPLAPVEFRFSAPWIKSEKKVKDVGRRLVKQSAQQLIQAGFTADHICKVGDPAEEIMKVAAKQDADLIVMGVKGLGTIDRVLLGSVSMQVLQYAHCPVLVVR
jgi:nucleotide-binding universal stress UspA family protein